MHALLQIAAQRRRDGLVRPGELHHTFIQSQASEQVVVVVVRGLVRIGLRGRLKCFVGEDALVVDEVPLRQVGGQVGRVLAQIRECHNVSHVLGVGLRVHHVDFDSVDHGSRIGNGQRAHGLVVLIHEVLAEEVVAVRLVVVRPDVELLGLGSPFHFDLAAFAFLLAEDRRVVQTPPLGLQL